MTVNNSHVVAAVVVVGVCLGVFSALQFDGINQRLDALEGSGTAGETPTMTQTGASNTVTIGDTAADSIRREAEAQGFYTPTQASRILGVTPRTVLNRIESGEIPAEKVGERWQIPLAFAD